jgi:uncharacterized membrane protein
MDPVEVDSRTAAQAAATIVPTGGGWLLSVSTVPLEVPAGCGGWARDVNTAGLIVGHVECTTSPQLTAVKWNLAGARTTLPLPPDCAGGSSWAMSVNEVGDITGTCAGPGLLMVPILWPKGSAPVVLQPTGYFGAYALDVNNRGDVAGTTADALSRAIVWTKGEPQLLTNPSGETVMAAVAISNSGMVVGNRANGTRAFVWDRGQPQPLASPAEWNATWVEDINAAGTAVGIAYNDPPGTIVGSMPVRWDRYGNASVIPITGTVPGYSPLPRAISNGGWIVGGMHGSVVTEPRAFLWSDATGTVPLSFPGVTFAEAFGVSDNGYIVGADFRYPTAGPALLWIVTLTPTTTP